MADRRRCTVYDNSNPREGKLMLLPASATLETFIRDASAKLGIGGKRLFMSTGGEVDDMALVRDNDSVYLSCGEPFKGQGKGGAQAAVEQNYSIAVMGPGSVGKSAMTLQYVQGVFVIDYDPTIEDAYRKQTAVDGRACVLDILDTAGQEDYIALRSTWMRERDGFLLVFSITEQATFDDLRSFYEQLQTMHEDRLPPIVVAGNKVDLADKREVTTSEAQRTAVEEWGACAYVETSAKTGENIDTAFARLVREVRSRRDAPEEAPTRRRRRICAIL